MRTRASLSLLLAGLWISACAPSGVEFQSVLFTDQFDTIERQAKAWPGPAVRFTVHDLRPPETFKNQRLPEGEVFPQREIYLENVDFTFDLAPALEKLLSGRPLPQSGPIQERDICILRYDHVHRALDEDIFQEEIYAQYGFRDIPSDPCPGREEFFYAGWGGYDIGGETPDSARSEAIGALVDHIQKSYAARIAAKEGHPPPSLDIAVIPPASSWEPPPAKISRFRWLRGIRLFFGALGESFSPYSAAYKVTPSPLQNRESVRTAAGMMLAQLLAPELHAAFAPPAPPDAAPATRPRLEIEPLFVGISGYDVAITKLRLTLLRADGTAFESWEAEGTCEPSPVTQCTIRRQLETISDKLRQELPISLVAAAISEKPVPAMDASPNPASSQ